MLTAQGHFSLRICDSSSGDVGWRPLGQSESSPSTHSHDPVLGIQDPRLIFASDLLDLPELLSISMLTWRRLGSVSVSATVCGSKTFFEVVPDPSGRLALGWAGASVLGPPPRPARPVLSPPRPALVWTQLQPPCQECQDNHASWASSSLSSSHNLGNVCFSGIPYLLPFENCLFCVLRSAIKCFLAEKNYYLLT